MRLTWSRRAGVAAALAGGLILIPGVLAGEGMPVAQQNALVQKYCTVCHTDASRNGGLSLEHFDAAHTSPSLAAMMVSKLTSGVSIETARAAASDPQAAALIATKMKGGAMDAAGIPIPEKATIDALIDALASAAAGAKEWDFQRAEDPATKTPLLTASILRERPLASGSGEARMYRLVLACDAATHEGAMQLAWAPMPTRGTLSASVDGKASLTYKVEGTERMGNGSPATTGPAAVSLFDAKGTSGNPKMRLPAESLRIRDLFSSDSIEFPFGDLPQAARKSLAVCFQ